MRERRGDLGTKGLTTAAADKAVAECPAFDLHQAGCIEATGIWVDGKIRG